MHSVCRLANVRGELEIQASFCTQWLFVKIALDHRFFAGIPGKACVAVLPLPTNPAILLTNLPTNHGIHNLRPAASFNSLPMLTMSKHQTEKIPYEPGFASGQRLALGHLADLHL